jgi:hypothetical protein
MLPKGIVTPAIPRALLTGRRGVFVVSDMRSFSFAIKVAVSNPHVFRLKMPFRSSMLATAQTCVSISTCASVRRRRRQALIAALEFHELIA